MANMGRTVVRPGIEIKHPRLVRGVKLHPVKTGGSQNFRDGQQAILRNHEMIFH